ncbi:hypothetical protein SEA_VASUNZINGA_73 [Mycobacterium phage VasuNzinga]|uniref:Uncharacterized protein n=1 Tax=Mycobacterium phage VasuNzinga TaxID=2301620 RepID=A0A385UHZ5_9CAUD|nr:hypothetical protein SEA_VASUNZINGA_73 [Mycobacterium phage VasuNzinga]
MLFGYQCVSCDRFWSCQVAPEQNYAIITKVCPVCLPNTMRRLAPSELERRIEIERRWMREERTRSVA